jgi:hypothetical protein
MKTDEIGRVGKNEDENRRNRSRVEEHKRSII